jgi:hypothetical protein
MTRKVKGPTDPESARAALALLLSCFQAEAARRATRFLLVYCRAINYRAPRRQEGVSHGR